MTVNETVPAPRSASGPGTGLSEVSGRIRELADRARADGTDTSVLDLVVDDLNTGGVTLAGTDLVVVYPPDVLLPDAQPKRWQSVEGWFAALRDVLVFAPIALTWWRLRDALEAYDQQKSTDVFLLGWARGFPQGDPAEPTTVTLGTSAIHVTLLIVLVAALTIGLHIVQTIREKQLSREEDRRRLATELARATFLLAAPPARPAGKPLDNSSADRLAAQLLASTVNLEGALRRTSEEIVTVLETGPGSRIQTALDGWTRSVDELTTMVRSLLPPNELAQELIRVRELTAREGEQLRAALDALVTDLRRAQETTGQEIHRHDLAVAAVRELAQRLGDSLMVFTERADNLVDSTHSLWQLVDQMESRNGLRHTSGFRHNADPSPREGYGRPSDGSRS
ncbi:hypothetical protein [Streptomyces endophyticus]|uniref:FUSC family protein n=1 Tax=Streptomyces endophyticus TaxID=714166 RepID=A0ABU6FG39_9ACTN|nr:hypothetical protein [Streptomyces endophyticus]MEB8342997.1 FUSC family protein [Streptomyces endophyticus]